MLFFLPIIFVDLLLLGTAQQNKNKKHNSHWIR